MPYQDSAGIWTDGWGNTHDVHPGEKITQAKADQDLETNVGDAEKCVNGSVHVPLTQPEFDALVSFCFNVGPGLKGKKSGFVTLKDGRPSTMLRMLNDYCDYDAAAREFLKWTKAGGVELAGLVRRRRAEKKLFESSEIA